MAWKASKYNLGTCITVMIGQIIGYCNHMIRRRCNDSNTTQMVRFHKLCCQLSNLCAVCSAARQFSCSRFECHVSQQSGRCAAGCCCRSRPQNLRSRHLGSRSSRSSCGGCSSPDNACRGCRELRSCRCDDSDITAACTRSSDEGEEWRAALSRSEC
ncbi:hypothetical protein JG688_00007994 [Phytophthora aleatoria]|uniref:Uncharacterized protein n=1 Tax=Phytophthora aleatoria TaxID=2496075 RepID=A0A8J5IWX4_9STRA|nr:hypothetical protein JG688_00007994 [Phytophthora aleatoria]